MTGTLNSQQRLCDLRDAFLAVVGVSPEAAEAAFRLDLSLALCKAPQGHQAFIDASGRRRTWRR